MIDRVLDEMCMLDWVSALWTFVRIVAAGREGTHTFIMPEISYDLEHILHDIVKQNGIDAWGWMSYHNEIYVTVKRKQAPYMQRLLDEAGIACVSGRLPEYAPTRGGKRQRRGVGAWLFGG